MPAFTQRVEVGAFYTDGRALYEVAAVNALGSIDAFRRALWIVRSGVATCR